MNSHDGVLSQAMEITISAKKMVDTNAALKTAKAAKEAINKENERF